MIRNLKVLGLALAATFALSAVGASAASAESALFTAAVTSEETASIDGGQTEEGGDKFRIGGELTCKVATLTGNAVSTGPESTNVTLEPTYEKCHAIRLGITRTATVTTNNCTYNFNATKTAGTFGADLTIECPGNPIEIHVYNTSNENDSEAGTLCTYDVENQTVTSGFELTNSGSDIVANVNATIAVNNTMPSFTCTTQTSSVYEGEDTLRATNEKEEYVNASVS